MRSMNFPGRVWLRRARAAARLEGGPEPIVSDIPMDVRSKRSKIIRQAKVKRAS